MEKIIHQKPTMVKIKSLMTKIKKRKSLSILPPRDRVPLMMLLVLFIQVLDINGVSVIATPTTQIDNKSSRRQSLLQLVRHSLMLQELQQDQK
jgi:hypothetical protein